MIENTFYRRVIFAVLIVVFRGAAGAAEPVKSRDFHFTYHTTVKGLAASEAARIWLPVPPSNEDQTVSLVAQDLPGPSKLARESKYGNLILFVEAKANASGEIALSVAYRVHRKEVRGEVSGKAAVNAQEAELFLKPDAKVPIGGKPLKLIADVKLPRDPLEKSRVFYDVVNAHMRYSKEGMGWGNGDAEWACDSKYGNCSDFHSLFISLARSHQVPAKFEIGFPLPEKRGAGEIPGYHCWAKFKPEGRGWIPVDISEANKNPKRKDYYFGNLTANRVAFSIGRDLTLVPKQAALPLNFFVYPYVEVDGKAYPAEKVERRFEFRDVEKK